MNQDFINWLNSADNNENNNTSHESQGTDLLVAPLSVADSHEDPQEIISPEVKEDDSRQEIINEPQNLQLEFNFESESENNNAHEDSRTQKGSTDSEPKPKEESEINNILQELRNLRKQVSELDDNLPAQYDEPPPETWAQNMDSELDEDSELYEHYEQGIDFQEYNDRIPHGTNFTRRLQRILHERKERAAEEKSREDAQRNSHPYITKSILLCLALITALLFAYGVLAYLQKRVPNYINANPVESKLEESEPQVQETNHFQIEMTQSKAGDETQADINHGEPGTAATPLTFEDYLREGNEAFNLGIYNSALKNFFRALELDDNDTRPYIGLAGAYRAKGLFFDSKRILDNALMIFRKDPTLETALKILEGDSKHGSCSKCNRSK